MGGQLAEFRVAYLIWHVDRCTLFGFPGVALERLCTHHDSKSFKDAMCAYRSLEKSKPVICIQESCSLGELRKEVVRVLTPYPLVLGERFARPLFLCTDDGLYECVDETYRVGDLISVISSNSIIIAAIMLDNLAGEIVELRKDGIKYIIHSNEQGGHNEPHVHVKSGEHEASLRIGDGYKQEGYLPPKKLKIAERTVSDHGKLLLDTWNAKSNGTYQEPVAYFHRIGVIPGDWPDGMLETTTE